MNKQFLLTLAVIEGAFVGAELLGVKMFVSCFEGLLFVWLSALGVTLCTQRKDFDGHISDKVKANRIIFWVLLLGGLLITRMPSVGRWEIIEIIDLIFWNGVTIALLFFIVLIKNNFVNIFIGFFHLNISVTKGSSKVFINNLIN